MKLLRQLHYMGSNRRFDGPALELRLSLAEEDEPLFTAAESELGPSLSESLSAAGIRHRGKPGGASGTLLDVGHHLVWLIENLLIAAGHSIDGSQVILDEVNKELRVVVASDDVASIAAASDIAIAMIAAVVPDGMQQPTDKPVESISAKLPAFLDVARPRAMVPETKAIIRAARKISLPVILLDRDPYVGVTSKNRVRPNGMLLLGHCREYRILDGPVFADRAGNMLPFISAAGLRRELLIRLGVPVLRGATQVDECSALLLVGKGFRAALRGNRNGWRVIEKAPHDQLVKLGQLVARHTAAAVVLLTFTDQDLSLAPGSSGGVTHALDFDLAPRLDQLLADRPGMLDLAAESLLEWGFPSHRPGRVPTFAVTGTNGKTTTCMMIRAMLMAAGRHVGLAGSVGVLAGDELTHEGDMAGFDGHLRVLERRDVDAAVLETARGGVLTSGFAFDVCDVGVCLNVASDHIGLEGVKTLDDMAEIKQAVVLRAQHVAVLNADDPHCLDMVKRLETDKVCLVSTSAAAKDLLGRLPESRACCCVREAIDGENWVVIYDPARVPVAPIASIPATVGGIATFNTSNAMHAIAACYFADVEMDRIREGIQRFQMDFETAPGRTNFYRGHPFDVLMDAMKNPAGASALARLVKGIETDGRKLIMVQARGDRDDGFIKAIGTALAGQFDHYVCQVHSVYPGEPESRAPALVREALLEAGVERHQITIKTDLPDAVETLLQMGSEGDLLVFTPGTGPAKSQVWKQVLAFRPEADTVG